MTETTNAEAAKRLTPEQERRRAVVRQMLADRKKREPMSRDEFKRMRDEGRC
ncbi:MAG: hypothetical protein OXS47_08895 [Chloroflexota bacterium]|nr:hypothetical protein [Chloroflexota bacterium]